MFLIVYHIKMSISTKGASYVLSVKLYTYFKLAVDITLCVTAEKEIIQRFYTHF